MKRDWQQALNELSNIVDSVSRIKANVIKHKTNKTMKTYILLKDLPDSYKGDEFVIREERADELVNVTRPANCITADWVNKTDWFKLKEDDEGWQYIGFLGGKKMPDGSIVLVEGKEGYQIETRLQENGLQYRYVKSIPPNYMEVDVKEEGGKIAVYEIFNKGDKVGFFFNEELAKEINFYLNTIKPINESMGQSVKATTYKNEVHYDLTSRPILFKTEDGVDIFEGNGVWAVYNWNCFFIEKCDSETLKMCYDGHKQFSTKEKAEEYVLNNNPLLSRMDVLNLLSSNTPLFQNHEGIDRVIGGLNKLVKSKL